MAFLRCGCPGGEGFPGKLPGSCFPGQNVSKSSPPSQKKALDRRRSDAYNGTKGIAPGVCDSALVFPTFHKMEPASRPDDVMPPLPSGIARGRQRSSGRAPACFHIAGEKTACIGTLGQSAPKKKDRGAAAGEILPRLPLASARGFPRADAFVLTSSFPA